MIKTQLHIRRLKALAQCLNSGQFAKYKDEVTCLHFDKPHCLFFFRQGYFLIHPSIELQLPLLFRGHFRTDFQENVKFLLQPTLATSMVLCFFFGLNTEEYFTLFMVSKQIPEKYGSKRITSKSGPKAYAYNINRFLESVEKVAMVEENVLFRKVLIEKVRPNHPDNIFRKFENQK